MIQQSGERGGRGGEQTRGRIDKSVPSQQGSDTTTDPFRRTIREIPWRNRLFSGHILGYHTQALSILSRVWKVILDTRLIVEYLPDTVLILE